MFYVWPVGLDRLSFFGDTTPAMPATALLNTWRHVGYTDGAGEWRMFWRIALPLLRPVMALVLVLTVIGSFQVFDTVAVTTAGGPINATRVIIYYISPPHWRSRGA